MIIERTDPQGVKVVTLTNQQNMLFNCGTIEGEDAFLGFSAEKKLLDATGILICLQGEAEITIEEKDYILRRNSMCVSFPNTVIQAHKKSDDYKGYALGGTTNFIFNLRFQSSVAIYLYIKEHPCIELNDNELQTILSLCHRLKDMKENSGHPFKNDISHHLLSILCYEISAVYYKMQPVWDINFTRKQTLFIQFLQLLNTASLSNRDVSYYAEKLCITPRYLSVITKEIMGFTANECITWIVIKNACLLLQASKFSIQEISDKLNFPNPSFFGQYFKKNKGMTPKEFRRKYQ